MNQQKSYPIVLSIAGSDSSGGAGIQADLKTFSALGIYGATALTAITAQNTQGVHSQFTLPPQIVYDQIVAVINDLHPSFIKIGMLANTDIVLAVAEALSNYSIPIILDPVIVSSSGHRLLSLEAQDVIKEKLLPLSTLITPNIPEMQALTNMPLSSLEEKELAAQRLMDYGVKAVLLKGGHEEGNTKTDILFSHSANGIQSSLFSAATISTPNIHGTGCTLSSAITAFLARGLCLQQAISHAKDYITQAITAGADIKIGQGFGPVNHGFNPLKMLTFDNYKLQFITHHTDTYSYIDSARIALEGGCRWIQLRMKDADDSLLEQTALIVQQMCRSYNATFIIDDNVLLAKKIGADGVHLGKNDMPIAEARKILGNQFIIGATVNSFDDVLHHLQDATPDYFGCGPFRFTSTKKNLAPILGYDGYKLIIKQMHEHNIHIPLVAIGGISKPDIPQLLDTGVNGIALSSSILKANNPILEMQEIMNTINQY